MLTPETQLTPTQPEVIPEGVQQPEQQVQTEPVPNQPEVKRPSPPTLRPDSFTNKWLKKTFLNASNSSWDEVVKPRDSSTERPAPTDAFATEFASLFTTPIV